MKDFAGKVAIVTGGASGVGRGLAGGLAGSGATVVVADINLKGARETVSEITAGGCNAAAEKVDVTEEADVKKLVGKTVKRHGRLDMMFNNAGVIVVGDMQDITVDHFRRVVNVNLWGAIHGTMSAYPVMVEQGFGHIVNMASVAGLVPYSTGVPYATTKHAIVGLSTSLRAEAKGLGVNVTVVCPGNIQSNIYKDGTILRAGWEDIMARLPVEMMKTEKAVKKILAGVRKNKAIIVFPADASIIWMLHRIKPALLNPILNKMINDFRELRGSA